MDNKIEKKKVMPITTLDGVQKSFGIMGIMKHWGQIMDVAKIIHQSGLVPDNIKTWQQTAVVILRGLELGFPPMYALDKLWVIGTKVAMMAEPMLALIKKNCEGVKIEILETTPENCKIKSQRPGQVEQITSYTYKEISNVDYWNNKNKKWEKVVSKYAWKNYRQDTLRSRCVTRMKREHFPDVDLGVSYNPEELGADVNEDGNVVLPESDVHAEPDIKPPPTIEVVETRPSDDKIADITPKGGKVQDGVTEPQITLISNMAKSHYFDKDDRVLKYRDDRWAIVPLTKRAATNLIEYLQVKVETLTDVERLLAESYVDGTAKEKSDKARQEIIDEWSNIMIVGKDLDGWWKQVEPKIKAIKLNNKEK